MSSVVVSWPCCDTNEQEIFNKDCLPLTAQETRSTSTAHKTYGYIRSVASEAFQRENDEVWIIKGKQSSWR